jgi:hypothetical protein
MSATEKMNLGVLTELIDTKFTKLGKCSCNTKEQFLFSLKVIYGDTFDMDSARIIYDTIYRKRFGEDCDAS